MRTEAFVGLRHLASTRKSFLSTLTLLAVLGVALGVTALTTVMSVAGGFIDTFRERVLGVNAHIVVSRFGLYFGDYEDLQRRLEEVPGVRTTAPYILHEMLITREGARARPGVLVKGTDISVLIRQIDAQVVRLEGDLDALRYTESRDGESGAAEDGPSPQPVGIALGGVVAERLGVRLGDEVTLLSPLRSLEAIGLRAESSVPTWARFRVEAILHTGFFDYDNRLAIVDYRALQELFRRGDVVTGVEVYVTDAMATAALMARIDREVTAGRFQLMDWPRIHRNLFASLGLQKLALTLVMMGLVFVASAVIFCVLIMLVLGKRREIAVLRAMGATKGAVLRIFIFQGGLIGLAGTSLGLVGGWLLCAFIEQISFGLDLAVYRIDKLPVTTRWHEFLTAGVGAVAISLIATLYPSWQATRITPVEGLRNDG